MKRTIHIILLLVVSLTTMGQTKQQGFTINCDNSRDWGDVYLVTVNGNRTDTLSSANIVNGKFQMVGKTDKPQIAWLINQGRPMLTFFLDNADYQLDGHGIKPIWVYAAGGGHDQQIKNQYDTLYIKHIRPLLYINDIYSKAEEQKDTALMDMVMDVFSSCISLIDKETDVILAKNPDEMVSAYVINQQMKTIPEDLLRRRYQLLGDKARQTDYGKEIAAYLKTLVGEQLPDFTYETPDNHQGSLYQVPGKVKILDFWASWCAPCRAENPRMKALYEKYHDRGLEILSITMDENKNEWRKAIEHDQTNWHHGFVPHSFESPVATQFKLNAIPFMVILDADNKIIAKGLRGDKLEAEIAKLLE